MVVIILLVVVVTAAVVVVTRGEGVTFPVVVGAWVVEVLDSVGTIVVLVRLGAMVVSVGA